jgi:serine/threonine protein kinase
VTEFVPEGDLWKYTFNPSVPIPPEHIAKIASAVVAGMIYLHSKNIM